MGRFTGKLNIYISIPPPPPTLNLNSSPQQKNSPSTKRYVVSCYFDRIWLLTMASFTNKYVFTEKKWTNSKKYFFQICKNICQNPFLDCKKIVHQNFQLQPPPTRQTHRHIHKYTHKRTKSIYLKNHVTYSYRSYRYRCMC